jgi:hypothetical protein
MGVRQEFDFAEGLRHRVEVPSQGRSRRRLGRIEAPGCGPNGSLPRKGWVGQEEGTEGDFRSVDENLVSAGVLAELVDATDEVGIGHREGVGVDRRGNEDSDED